MQWRNVARLTNRSCNRHTITLFPTISKRKNCIRLPLTGPTPARVCCCRPESGVDFEPMACVHRGNQLYCERAVSKVISNPTNPYKLKCTNPMRTSSRINRCDFTRGVFAAGIGIGLSRGADMGTGTVFGRYPDMVPGTVYATFCARGWPARPHARFHERQGAVADAPEV